MENKIVKMVMPSVSLTERFMLSVAATNQKTPLGIQNIRKILKFSASAGKEVFEVVKAFKEKQSWFSKGKELTDLIPLIKDSTDLDEIAAQAWKEVGDVDENEFAVIVSDIAEIIPNFTKKMNVAQQKQFVKDLLQTTYDNYATGKTIWYLLN